MYFKNWEELRALCPIENGKWNREVLYEYLVWCCYRDFSDAVNEFMAAYRKDEALADLLFDVLSNDDYDGSDSQMGAAYYIARLDRELLRKKKDLLLLAQQNEVEWKRPFHDEEYLSWL